MERNELIAYAMDFASYLESKIEGINRIILHGSVSREDFDEESDIDIFIDTKEKNLKNKTAKEPSYLGNHAQIPFAECLHML